MKRFLAFVLSFVVFTLAMPAQSLTVSERTYRATALLYGQGENGGMVMHCTVTAYAKLSDGYLFVTASHCLSDQEEFDVEDTSKHIRAITQPQFITFDAVDTKEFFKAEVLAVGVQPKGDDFAILRIRTKADIPTIALGDESKETFGSEVLSVASPAGLGRQLMRGYISMPKLDRPINEDAINWAGAMMLQIPSGPGASGSSIISLKQEKIIAFLVGHVSGANIAAIPVSRFKIFSQAINERKYRWWDATKYPTDMPVLPVE